MTENRTFWKTIKPFLIDKTTKTSQDHLIAKTFNKYLVSIPIKNMPKNREFESFDSSEEDPLSCIIKKYQNHPSINLIKSKNKSKTFRFRETNTDEIKKFIEKLDPKKSQKFDMNANILKKNAAFFAKYICNDIHALVRSSKFHNKLKEADIVHLHKKKSKFSKENYRPISILPNIFKVYRRCLYEQISNFFEDVFSKYQCGFCKALPVSYNN